MNDRLEIASRLVAGMAANGDYGHDLDRAFPYNHGNAKFVDSVFATLQFDRALAIADALIARERETRKETT